jgi:organic radical activating enzyme
MLRDKVRTTNTLSINEIYESVQGEGLLVGTPSVFIRLQGCNLRCPWCDQPEALSFKAESTELEDVLKCVEGFSSKHVVITGGEPFAHENLHLLTKELLLKGYSVQIETNGTLWNPFMEDVASAVHITCSPKAVANFFVHPKVLRYADELKFVVDEELQTNILLRKEFEPFLKKGKVVLQPESNKGEFLNKALRMAGELLRRDLRARVIPQVHKLLGLK